MEEAEKPNKAVDNRNPNGTFGANNNANPLGRPKGKSMKEYMADKFRTMNDEEKEKWIFDNKLEAQVMWKMAEGNPAIDVTSKGESFAPIPILGNVPKDNSDKQGDEPSKES